MSTTVTRVGNIGFIQPTAPVTPSPVREYLRRRGVNLADVQTYEDVSYRCRGASRCGTLTYGQNSVAFGLRGGRSITLDNLPYDLATIVRAG